MEEQPDPRSDLPFIPQDMWSFIAEYLNLPDIGALRQVCFSLSQNQLLFRQVWRQWLKLCAKEFVGMGAQDMTQILARSCHIVMDAEDMERGAKLLNVYGELRTLAAESHDKELSANISRLMYFIRFMMAHEKFPGTRPKTLLANEDYPKRNIDYDMMDVTRVMALGAVGWMLLKIILIPFGYGLGRGLEPRDFLPLVLFYQMMAGALFVVPAVARSRFYDRCRHSTFWKKVDSLKDNENVPEELRELAVTNQSQLANILTPRGLLVILYLGLLLATSYGTVNYYLQREEPRYHFKRGARY